MATNISDFRSKVLRTIPSCPSPIMDEEIVEAIRIFCEETLIWKQDLASRVSIVADTYNYTLTAPSDTEIIAIHRVMYKQDGKDDDQFSEIDPTTEEVEDRTKPGQWRYTEAKSPSKFLFTIGGVLRLIPIPTEASSEGLLVTVYSKPERGVITCEDFFFKRYLDAIKWGAQGRILSIKDQPWTDFALGKYYETKFEEEIGKASFENQYSGRTLRKTRVRLPKYFR